MTKNFNENEKEAVSHERQSLLDILDNKNQSANRKTILHRVILIGKLRNFPNKTKLGEYYDRMFRNQQQQQQQQVNSQKAPNPFQEKVTGILIVYPTIMIHVIESSIETIKGILQDMVSMHADEENGMIADSRIICLTHEIHIRIFPVYVYKMMNLTLEFDSNDPSESVESLINDMVVRLLRLGKYLNDNSKGQLRKEIIDNLNEQHPEFLPNQNYANFLMKTDLVMSPEKYLSYHNKPINVVLESELTWPAPSKLFPYQ